MDSVQLMEKVAEVSPEVYQFLLDTADQVKASPFHDEIVGELDGIMKKAAVNWGQLKGGLLNAGGTVLQGAGRAALGLGALAAGGVAVALAGDVYDAAKRGLTKTDYYRTMLEHNPDLKDKPAPQVQALFSTLHRFNPDFAGDPLVAGSFVRNHVEMAGAEHGQVDMNTLNTLITSRKNLHDSRKFNPIKLGK